jgi:release factor glutamine methyltransferase
MSKSWTILELLTVTSEYFSQKDIDNPRLNSEYLLCNVLNLKRIELYLYHERPVSDNELLQFRRLVSRRARHEPLQYIIGETSFMGLPFRVTPSALIPRPETEGLVEEVLKMKTEFRSPAVTLAEIGCGSGCIAISLAQFWPGATIYATDVSPAAIDLTIENSRLNHLQTTVIGNDHYPTTDADNARLFLLRHDVFSAWPENLPQQVDILVSNPPYISAAEMTGLDAEVRDYEPHIALTDFADGLRFYRRLFEIAASPQSPAIKYMMLEMSGAQPEKIIEMAEAFDFDEIQIASDLNEIPRILKVKVNYE